VPRGGQYSAADDITEAGAQITLLFRTADSAQVAEGLFGRGAGGQMRKFWASLILPGDRLHLV
jgi:hypothetical protein